MEYSNALATLLSAFGRLGLPVTMEKLEGPTPSLTFLGFQLDAVNIKVNLSLAECLLIG
jgi:hypothetical protein